MKKSLLILITLFTVFIGYSQTFNALDNNNNTLEYDITTGTTVEVRNYVSGGTDIDIPATVDNPNDGMTYNVTAIGISAFENNSLTSVIIPSSVIIIRAQAFKGNQLTNVTLLDGLTTINASAFRQNQLTEIVFPNSVVNIYGGAFQQNQISNITFPANITSINPLVFAYNQLTNLAIPEGITSIEDSAFSYNLLTDLALPSTLTTIDQAAFYNNQLTSVTIPSNVTSIGQIAFNSNPTLTCVISESTTPPTIISTSNTSDSFDNRSNINLSIPSGTLGAYTTAQWTGFFSVAEGLSGTFTVNNITYQINATPNNEVTVTDYNPAGGTIVVIPDTVSSGCTDFSVTDIGLSAFANNNNLTSVTIPDTVLTVGVSAFAQNNNLDNVVIGNNVTSIGDAAFLNNNLTSITIPDSVLTIGDGAFAQNNSLDDLVIGNNVTSIGDAAFRYANFTSIIIPASVTYIGFVAFGDILLLNDVTSLATIPPTIITGTNDTFTNSSIRGNINLHIPPNTTGAYATNTGALWTDFLTVTEDAALSTSDFELANDIKVITTPDAIKIMASNSIKLKNYTVYNISGAKVTSGKQSEIVTTSFSSGIYILKLDFDKGTVVKKVAIN